MGRRTDELRVELARMASTVRSKVAEVGVGATAREIAYLLSAHATYPLMLRRRRSARFRFGDTELEYELARYNHTWLNERTLEVAVAKHMLSVWPAGRTLEVGNVLGHYGVRGHDVIDRYETVEGVINGDIVSWKAESPYDVAVSISTLEHVRFDEDDKDPHGPLCGLEGMRRAIRPGGRLLVTVPLGYNPGLDDDIRSGAFSFPRRHFYRRISGENDWREVGIDEALSCAYGSLYRNANAVLVGIDP